MSLLVMDMSISELQHDPNNARKHSKRNLEAIKGSLQKFGQQKPIVIDENNIVLAGNGTLAAAKDLKWAKISCIRTELRGFQATAYALADNRTSELAEWDNPILKMTLDAFEGQDFDVASVGFDDDFMKQMKFIDDDVKLTEQAVPEEEYLIIVECKDEIEQSTLFEELNQKGVQCKLM